MWNEMGEGHYRVGRAPSYTGIRDPNIVVIFVMLCLYLVGWKSGIDKVHNPEMYLRGCICRKYLENVRFFFWQVGWRI